MKLSIQERKKYVISLHKSEYTIRQIAKELHMSTRDVNKILKENKKEERETNEKEVIEIEEEEKKRLFSSKRSEALQLYKEGTSPLDVAIELKISAEAKEFYHEYCSLLYPPQFLQIYNEINNTSSLNQFIKLFRLTREKGLSIEEAIEAIESINNIYLLKEEHQDLSNDIADLKKSKDFLKADNSSLNYQNEKMEKRLNFILEEIEIKEKVSEIISKKLRHTQEEIYKINSGIDYYKARERIKLVVSEFLGNKKNVIALAVLAVFKAIKENYQKEIPIKDLPKFFYEYVSGSSDKEVYREKLRETAEKVWNSSLDVCTDDIINPSSNISKD